MEIFSDYVFLIVLILTITSIFLYKKITKDPNAVTAKFIGVIDIKDHKIYKEDVLKAMEASNFKNAYFNEENRAFKATVGFSMSSYFELIEIRLIEKEGKQSLNFFSICGVPIQVYDWGKNKRNYNRFVKNINKL